MTPDNKNVTPAANNVNNSTDSSSSESSNFEAPPPLVLSKDKSESVELTWDDVIRKFDAEVHEDEKLGKIQSGETEADTAGYERYFIGTPSCPLSKECHEYNYPATDKPPVSSDISRANQEVITKEVKSDGGEERDICHSYISIDLSPDERGSTDSTVATDDHGYVLPSRGKLPSKDSKHHEYINAEMFSRNSDSAEDGRKEPRDAHSTKMESTSEVEQSNAADHQHMYQTRIDCTMNFNK